jgi:hypothetical protein
VQYDKLLRNNVKCLIITTPALYFRWPLNHNKLLWLKFTEISPEYQSKYQNSNLYWAWKPPEIKECHIGRAQMEETRGT